MIHSNTGRHQNPVITVTKKNPNVYKNLFHNPQCSHYLLKNFCKRKNNYNHFLFTFFRHEDSVKSVHIYSIEIDLIIKWRKTINTFFKKQNMLKIVLKSNFLKLNDPRFCVKCTYIIQSPRIINEQFIIEWWQY